MDKEQDSPEKNKEFIENLLYNHDIVLISQFIKDLSFDKKEDFLFFEEDDFKGKTNFNLNIDLHNEEKDDDTLLLTLAIKLVGSLNEKNIFVLELDYCGVFKMPNVSQELMEKQINDCEDTLTKIKSKTSSSDEACSVLNKFLIG